MQKKSALTILGVAILVLSALPSFAEKIKEDATLKDTQPVGIKDKSHKHQAYDFFFDAQGKIYTCRTDPDHSVNATDFVVGTRIHVEIDNEKVKIKTPQNKKVECKVVRVEMAGQAR